MNEVEMNIQRRHDVMDLTINGLSQLKRLVVISFANK